MPDMNNPALTVKPRSEGDPAFQWDLTAIFPSDGAWRQGLDKAQELIPLVESYAGRLGQSGTVLLEYMDLGERISEELSLVYGYASLKSDEDTAVAVYQDMKNKALSLSVALSTASAFATPELIAIPEETLERFFAETPGLEKYRTALHNIRRMKEHVLSPKEEALLAAAGEIAEGPYQVFNLFEGADLKFPEVLDSSGQAHQLTTGSFIPLMHDPDRTLRKNTFTAFYDTWLGMQNTTAALLNAQNKQLQFFAAARKYSGPLAASLDATDVPVSVYESLLQAVHAHLPLMHRYMALRKRLMGLEELHFYDIYTPLVPDADVKISYAEACATVLEALEVLGEDYCAVLRRAFAERWIDVYENVGKRSGAYSSGMAKPHPYVLLNHKDTLDSMFTIAHELGHAMHSYLSAQSQPTVYADYVIFVAEVASTVNECLLMRALLKKTTDSRRRAYLINYFLEQFRTTVYRQTMFAEFEKELGEMTGRGDALTAEALNALYLDLNRRYYGDAIVPDERIQVEWSRIPHFYYDYYVFQYATGFSAAVAISQRILEEGAPAVADYLRFLSAGSSQSPIALLKIAGVDMSTPQPVSEALTHFGELLDEMESLL